MTGAEGFLAQSVSRSLDHIARALEDCLCSGDPPPVDVARSLLAWTKDAQRDIAPLAYPKLEVVR